MYTLLKNEQVVTGPRDWNPRYFEHFLRDECHISYTLPIMPISEPLYLSESVKLVPTHPIPNPSIDDLFEGLTGPQLSYDADGNHISAYVVQSHTVDSIQVNLKAVVANTRWIKETTAISRDINGRVLTLESDRESRNLFFHALILSSDTDSYVWKFPEGFATLSKSDLHTIVVTLTTYVQECFSWEASKMSLIDAALTIEELKAVDLIN